MGRVTYFLSAVPLRVRPRKRPGEWRLFIFRVFISIIIESLKYIRVYDKGYNNWNFGLTGSSSSGGNLSFSSNSVGSGHDQYGVDSYKKMYVIFMK